MTREILLEMYEKLWNADKDKWTWNVILKDTLEKLETIEALVKQAKEINRNRIIELNNRDLAQNGIEND